LVWGFKHGLGCDLPEPQKLRKTKSGLYGLTKSQYIDRKMAAYLSEGGPFSLVGLFLA